ncbi:MAG TPA: phage tail sheath subtilisin-like domain-containing protein [Pyrinomonadaceae bacterium]|nr:phage tail sheath subtilisin-like domain-containing protein [Pyrinomonadaceae bacterium]
MRSAATVPGLSFSVSPPAAERSPLRSDVAGFIGRTRRGPVGVPIRVEGWRGYQREFGGLAGDADMTYAIRGYFENEGEVAHVIRLCHPSAKSASAEWKIGALDKDGNWVDGSPAGFEHTGYRITASSLGAWANNTRIAISYRRRGASGRPELDITIAVPDEPTQYFTGLSLSSDLASETAETLNTFEEFIASGSRFVRLEPLDPTEPKVVVCPQQAPHSVDWELKLEGGQDSEGKETPGKLAYLDALTKLGDINEVALVAVPGLFNDIQDDSDALEQQNEVLVALVEQAEELRDRLVLIDVKTESDHQGKRDQAIREVKKTLDWVDVLRTSFGDKAARAAVVYHPRLTIQDPLGGVRSPLRSIPPSGHVAGVISRLDRERGAHHTPANAEIFGAVDVTQNFDPVEQARLNMSGVNLLRCYPGRGLLVWGGRTLHLDRERRFLVYRRLIHRLVRAIRRVAEPLVFDNNGPELWLALVRSITTVLLEAWRAGALKGARQEEAFRVRCDEKLNPPDEQDLGRVFCEIEVAPAAPMEFIQLRLSFSGDGRLEVFES